MKSINSKISYCHCESHYQFSTFLFMNFENTHLPILKLICSWSSAILDVSFSIFEDRLWNKSPPFWTYKYWRKLQNLSVILDPLFSLLTVSSYSLWIYTGPALATNWLILNYHTKLKTSNEALTLVIIFPQPVEGNYSKTELKYIFKQSKYR